MKTFMGGLALAAALGAPLWAFTVVRLVPAKIFTPNSDAANDTIKICFDNPSSAAITLAKVFDLAGREVADLKSGADFTVGSLCPEFLEWNGRTRDGRAALGGIYVYRVDADYEAYSGTVVLAR